MRRTPQHARTPSPGRTRDGGFTTLEFALWAPLMLIFFLGLIQAGIWYHARDTARFAASEALQAAQVVNGTDSDGYAAAEAVLDSVNSVANPSVTVTRTTDQVSVTVSGSSPSLVPFMDIDVSQSATGPIRDYTAP